MRQTNKQSYYGMCEGKDVGGTFVDAKNLSPMSVRLWSMQDCPLASLENKRYVFHYYSVLLGIEKAMELNNSTNNAILYRCILFA